MAFNAAGHGIHGQIFASAQGETGKRLNRYRVSLVPQLSYLALRTNQRIFQQLTVPQIIALVLEEHGITAKGTGQPDLEDYDYPARFSDRARGKHLSQRVLERHRADYQLAARVLGRFPPPCSASSASARSLLACSTLSVPLIQSGT